MEYTIANIDDFYSDIENKPNPKLNKLLIYQAYMRDQKLQEKERAILDKAEWKGCTNLVTIINDDIAIVEHIDRDRDSAFQPVVRNHKNAYCANSFDEALLMALSIKYTGEQFTGECAFRMFK